MFRFWLITLIFCLSGCGERNCIKPESLSNLRGKLDIVSTQQKWVDSGVNISDRIRVTEINIIPNKINFCPKQYGDFLATNDISTNNIPPPVDFAAYDLDDPDPISVINEQLNYLKMVQDNNAGFLSTTFKEDVKSGRVSYCFNRKGLEERKNEADRTGGITWKDTNSRIDLGNIQSHIKACGDKKDYFENLQKMISLPFELKEGDSISFSVIGSKVCKDKEDDTKIRYVKIDEKCGEKETEYFANVLNQEKCQRHNNIDICPNKYKIDKAGWLNGKEYWNSDFSKSDQDEKEGKITNIINSIKQGQNIDCSKLSSDEASAIDTYILNYICGNTCGVIPSFQHCVQVESNAENSKLSTILQFIDSLPVDDSAKRDEIIDVIGQFMESKEEIKTYIPSLKITMAGENFEHLQGGIRTNYDYVVKKDHPKDENLTFIFNKAGGSGGYNMRVTKNHSLEKNLYICVSDKSPKHKPGESAEDISVDISKVHDVQYMEGLKEKLKGKNGTIHYGIKDHGCNYENEGEFNISLTIKEPPTKTFSAIYTFFDEKVKSAFFGSSYKDSNAIHSDTSPVKSLYESFIKSSKTNTIRSTIISLLVLYIVLYTLYYFFGLTHASVYEFLIVCVKIGIITQLLQDNSWNFFYNNAFSIFVNSPKQLIEIANFRGTTSNVFEFLDLPLNRFFSPHSVLLIVSLIFSGPLGIVAFCLVIWGLIIVVLSIFNALFSFVASIAMVALLLSLAPIFIICLLFKYTRQMFNKWLGNLAKFAIHPVIMLIFISLISQVMDYIVYSVFDFEVCTTCIFGINLKIFEPCLLYAYASKYTPNITAMMSFVILGHAMKALVKASSEISDLLFDSYVPNDTGKQYKQSLLGMVGLDQESVGRRRGEAPTSSGTTPQIPQRPQIPSGK